MLLNLWYFEFFTAQNIIYRSSLEFWQFYRTAKESGASVVPKPARKREKAQTKRWIAHN